MYYPFVILLISNEFNTVVVEIIAKLVYAKAMINWIFNSFE